MTENVECRNCGLKLEYIDEYLVDQDALDHVREKHPDEIVSMLNDVFSED